MVGIGGSTKVDWQGSDGWAARGFFATKDKKAAADKLFISCPALTLLGAGSSIGIVVSSVYKERESRESGSNGHRWEYGSWLASRWRIGGRWCVAR